MSALTRTYRELTSPLHRHSDSFELSEHKTASTIGVVLAGLALITVLVSLPDFLRYLKISRM